MPVLPQNRFKRLYSNLFTESKPKVHSSYFGFKIPNSIKFQKFHGICKVSNCLSETRGNNMAFVDIQDAHLHVPTYPPHRHFLSVRLGDNHFQFIALHFCLSSSPRVLTKLITPLLALRTQGIQIAGYLDDPFLKHCSPLRLSDYVHRTIEMLLAFCWVININICPPAFAFSWIRSWTLLKQRSFSQKRKLFLEVHMFKN